MLKKILAVVVLIALAYTAYTILQCTVMGKSAAPAAKPRPVKAASMLANAYHANIKSQQATNEKLKRMDVMDTYSPTLGISKVMGVQGMVQDLIFASASRARASK